VVDADDPDNWAVADLTMFVEDESACTHMARHDPVRVLREVAAKRAILAEHPHIRCGGSTARKNDVGCEKCDNDDGVQWYPGYCATVRAIAAVWNDHPDYRTEWKP
jgi:hypothetical protein